MLFNLGDKEILIILAVFGIVTVGLSGLAAFSMGKWRSFLRRRGRSEGTDEERA